MPDRSEEDTKEELEALDDEPSQSGGSSTDADIEDLEAELGIGGADGEGSEGEDSDAVGLDRDPSEEYADLLGDAPAERGGPGAAESGGAGAAESGGAGAAESGGAGAAEAGGAPRADEDDGGFLSGLFGGSESAAADSPAADRETAVDADDILDDVDAGPSTDADAAAAGESQTSAGSLRSRLAGFFSLRAFLGAVLAIVVLGGVGRTFVPIVGGPVGVAVGAFLVGLVSSESRYLEVAVAGALVGALGAFAGGLSVAVAAGATRRLLAAGGVGGLVVSLIGAYFGNDLRAGLVGGVEYADREL